MNSFNNFLSGTLHGIGYAGVFRSLRFADGDLAQAAVKDKAYQTISETFEMIEGKLSADNWVHGDDYTTSDAYLTVLFGCQRALDRELPKFPKIAALAARVLERPAVQRAIAAENTPGLHNFNAVI